MAIANPEQNVFFCEGTSGARLEYQTPDRDVLESEWAWDGITYDRVDLPIRYSVTTTLGTFIETGNIAAGGTFTTVNNLVKNRYYTFVVSGLIVQGFISFDACFVINSVEETTEPSNLLVTNDEQFIDMFFKAARDGTVEYDGVTHEYSVGYIGNDTAVTFTLGGSGDGSLTIDIYENDYQLLVQTETEGDPPTPIVLTDITQNNPFENLNIACGGSCPSRTTFSCPCGGEQSCYFDDGDGAISLIFQGTANP